MLVIQSQGCPAVPWWDRQCSVLRKVTGKCFRRHRNSGSQQSKLIYKRALAKQRNYYKKAKRDSWLHYINGINSKTSLALVWKKVRKLSGKFVPHPVPNLKIGDQLVTDPDSVADIFGEHFANVSNPSHYPTRLQSIKDAEVLVSMDSGGLEDSVPFPCVSCIVHYLLQNVLLLAKMTSFMIY